MIDDLDSCEELQIQNILDDMGYDDNVIKAVLVFLLFIFLECNYFIFVVDRD